MTKLVRITGKTFGETADPTDNEQLGPEIGQFGSALAGTYNGTSDVATIQSLSAWSEGFIGAVTPQNQYPPLPEMTGALKVLSYQENYILQQGIPEWDSETTYYTNGFCAFDGLIYKSIADSNLNNQPDEEPTYWEVYGAVSDYADQNLSNLTNLGNARLMYRPFTIDTGTTLNGKNNTLTYSGSVITCAPCTITTCDGKTLQDANTKTFDVSTIPSTETPWTQPILTSNGTLGGASFAVAASTEFSGYNVWKAFDGQTTGENFFRSGSNADVGTTHWIKFYNPQPIKVTKIAYLNEGQSIVSPISGAVYGSNDNSSWTEITTYTNSVYTSGETWYIDLSNNQNAYTYHKVEFKNGASAGYIMCMELTITATVMSQSGGYIFKNYSDGSLSVRPKITYADTAPANSNDNELWMDTSTVPANLKSYSSGSWTNVNNLVLIGECTVSSNAVSSIKNRYFNACPYMRDLVESYHNGKSYYDIYSDGYCEQSGFIGGTGTEYTINLLKTYLDDTYTITYSLGYQLQNTALEGGNVWYGGITTNSFKFYLYGMAYYAYWKTEGYIF